MSNWRARVSENLQDLVALVRMVLLDGMVLPSCKTLSKPSSNTMRTKGHQAPHHQRRKQG